MYFRPHRTECKDIACCWRCCVVCLSVCVLCVCMLDATAVQKWLNWSTCGLVVGARNNVSDGVPGSPLGKGQFWGLSPPLKCIRLCKQHMPAAARGCRLVCRGSTLWRKHCFSEWTRLPRGWHVWGDATFCRNSLITCRRCDGVVVWCWHCSLCTNRYHLWETELLMMCLMCSLAVEVSVSFWYFLIGTACIVCRAGSM